MMKKYVVNFLLVFCLLGGTINAVAVEQIESTPRASLYLDAYAVGIDAKGNRKMLVTFIVYGTDIMDCLGAQQIVIEEWDGIEWTPTATYSVEKNSKFYASNVSEHAESITFYGLPGIQYRATLYAYAELDGVFDMGTVTSNPETCR